GRRRGGPGPAFRRRPDRPDVRGPLSRGRGMTTLSWWQGLIPGLVQGLTEFLPVSSSGHLVLAERLVGFTPQGVFFEVAVHLATLLAVLAVYRERLIGLLRGLFSGERDALRYAGLLLLGSVPAGLAGVL